MVRAIGDQCGRHGCGFAGVRKISFADFAGGNSGKSVGRGNDPGVGSGELSGREVWQQRAECADDFARCGDRAADCDGSWVVLA